MAMGWRKGEWAFISFLFFFLIRQRRDETRRDEKNVDGRGRGEIGGLVDGWMDGGMGGWVGWGMCYIYITYTPNLGYRIALPGLKKKRRRAALEGVSEGSTGEHYGAAAGGSLV